MEEDDDGDEQFLLSHTHTVDGGLIGAPEEVSLRHFQARLAVLASSTIITSHLTPINTHCSMPCLDRLLLPLRCLNASLTSLATW